MKSGLYGGIIFGYYAVAQTGLMPWRIAGSGTGQETVFCNYSTLPDGCEQKMF